MVAHVPGKVVRRLVIGPLRVRTAGRTRLLELAIRNAGNVMERLAPGRVVLAVLRHGRVVARLRPPGRELLPHGRALVVGAVPGSASRARDRARDPRRASATSIRFASR